LQIIVGFAAYLYASIVLISDNFLDFKEIN